MTDISTRGAPARTLLGVLLLAAGLVTGYVAGRFAPEPASASAPAKASSAAEDASSTPAALPAEQQEQLAALGYSAGSVKAPEHSGITKNDATRAFNSLNVFTSGHFPGASLMTMDGRVLHTWEYSFEKLWPGKDTEGIDVSFWRRVHLFENGDIIAILEPFGIFKLDKDSNLLWQHANGAHHDFVVAPNGHIFVLTRESKRLTLRGTFRPVLEEFVIELSPEGEELRRVSILDAFENSEYRSLLADAPSHWDITHTNSLKLLDANMATHLPSFQPGRFLLSVREIGTIAVLDFGAGRIEWATKGMWWRQHEATLVGPGNILLFDNRSLGDQSRVLEFDPATNNIVWSYGGKPDQAIHSSECGLAMRLPNGDTLVTESLPGRVLEVAPTGEIVWEYVNPNRAKKDPTLIASIFDFQRLPVDFTPRWLDSAAVHGQG